MAQLNSSPILNLTTGARVDAPGQGTASSGAAKPGEEAPRGFAQMMAGAIQSRSAEPSKTVVTGAGSKSDAANVTQGLIKDLQAKISELLGQQSLPADVSASLTALQKQLLSLQQKLGALTMPANAAGQTVLDTLVTQLKKVRELLAQDKPMDAGWVEQLQGVVANLHPEHGVSTGHIQTDSSVSMQSDQSANGGAGGLGRGQTMAAGMRPDIGQGRTDAGGTHTPNSGVSSVVNPGGAAVSEQMVSITMDDSGPSNKIPINKSINNLVQASVLLAGAPNKKPDEVLKAISQADTNSSGTPISSANSASGTLAGFSSTQTNSLFPTLPSVLDLSQPKLADNMGQQIQWMMGKNISKATLELNPGQLGPLKITIDMQQNQTHIQVLAAHHLTRDMLEQSLPRLREFLQDAGLTNAQVSIGQGGGTGQNADQGKMGGSGGRSASGGRSPQGASVVATSVTGEPVIQATTTWRLDTFA